MIMRKERVKEIREQIKKEFPFLKISARKDKWRSISIDILSAPEKYGFQEMNKPVNEFYLEEQFKGEALSIMARIREIANEGNRWFETSDYGTQPSFYVWLGIGKREKPFKTTEEIERSKEARDAYQLS